MDSVFKELLEQVPKNKKRKVCNTCNELGHGITSPLCIENINKKKKMYLIVKQCVFEYPVFTDIPVLEMCKDIAERLNITTSLTTELYQQIPATELLDRPYNFKEYMDGLPKVECYDCKKKLPDVCKNSHRTWKDNIVCDTCWCHYDFERAIIWRQINDYKKYKCNMCHKVKQFTDERFPYDHLNMFTKSDPICMMVQHGEPIEKIKKELDICQVLCVSCHHIVTDLEHKFGFIRIKKNLTLSLTNGKITQDEYDNETKKIQLIYDKKMKPLYKKCKIKLVLRKK